MIRRLGYVRSAIGFAFFNSGHGQSAFDRISLIRGEFCVGKDQGVFGVHLGIEGVHDLISFHGR